MWFAFALATAIFTSFADVLRKKAVNRADVLVIAWAWRFFVFLFALSFLRFEPTRQLGPAFYWTAPIIVVCIISSTLLYVKSLKHSDMSLTIPMLAFSPLFLLITSPLILGEFPHPLGLVGILLIVAGSYILNYRESSKGYFEPFKALVRNKGTRLMLIVAVIYSIGANIEKIGVLNASPLFWIVTTEAVASTALLPIMLKNVQQPVSQIKKNFKYLFLLGLFEAIAMFCQMKAYQLAIVPYVISIKRTSVIWSALLGFLILKEGGFKERLIGIIFMVLGVFLIGLC